MKMKKSLLTIRCKLMVLLLTFIVLFLWPAWSAPQALPGPATNQVVTAQSFVSSPSTTLDSAQSNPQLIVDDCIGWILIAIAAAAIIVGAIWYVMCQLGLCGNKGNQPPQAPNNGDNGNIVRSAVINTNIVLPTTVFYISNGVVVSNSAGLSISSLPPFLSLSGTNILNGSQINSTLPGTTRPPTIALWAETNTFYDAMLDPNHPYQVIYNYTLLGSTNLPDWHEVCTVVGWINGNQKVPLSCSITYTNGQAIATNWTQFFLDSSHQPTNIVVYGALPSVGVNTSQPAIRPADIGLPLPGGAVVSSAQFYTLTANTNDIKTSWP